MSEIKKPIKAYSTASEVVAFYNTDLTGKVVIVTGANSGIGLETARVLSSVGAKVILPCRTLEKSNGAIDTIKKTVPDADLIPMELDLADLASVRAFAQDFINLDLSLDILINNAGIMICPKSFTKDGFETQFGVNHLGHFLLTELLTEKLKSSAPSRIVIVSSCVISQMLSNKGIDFDNLNAEKGYNSCTAYGQAKFANVLHAKELQRRFDQEGVDITVTSLHPGVVETNLGRYIGLGGLWDTIRSTRNYKTLLLDFMHVKKVPAGASTNVLCAVSPDIIKGEFYSDNAVNTALLNEQTDNLEMAKKLFDVSKKLVA